MNRIILIGNGFDLAHDLKTSYADFIEWYWEKWGKSLLGRGGILLDDGICSFRLKSNVGLANWYDVWHYYYGKDLQCGSWKEDEVLEIAKQDRTLCDFTIKSPFFETICEKLKTKKWVDVEDVYYEFLKKSNNPQQLNDDLEFIKKKLIEYLNTLTEPTLNSIIQNQIFAPISKEDIAIGSMEAFFKMRVTSRSLSPDKIMLLNFNYTNTADIYLQTNDLFSVNHIHGSLSSPESVIFGYGDEHDDEYQPLMKKNEYLRHIKSFHYLESSDYRNMLGFIEEAPFQICIMGHSCGISDRTLLNTLFEHPNCVSIKPYYYQKEDGTDNYFDLICSIARSISDPHLMRDRVVRKEHCQPLGQLS